MTKTISVPVELLERIASNTHRPSAWIDELRALLAQPAEQPSKPFTFAAVLGERIQQTGSERLCQEWADAWNAHPAQQRQASVVPLYLAEQPSANLEPDQMLDLRAAAIAASPWAEHAERTGAFVKGAIWHAQQPSAAKVPDGWRLVPVEPTKEMIVSACMADNCKHMSLPNGENKRRAYRAMLAAAPQPAAERGEATPARKP